MTAWAGAWLWSTLRHALHVIVEAPAGLIGKFLLAHLQRVEAVEAEIAEVPAQLAPCAERPGAAPEEYSERSHSPLRILRVAVAVFELDVAMFDDPRTQRIEPHAPLRVDEVAGREQPRLMDRGALLLG